MSTGTGITICCRFRPEHLKRVSDWRGLHFGEYVPYSETASVNCRMSQKLEEMKCLQEQAADGTHLLFLAAVYVRCICCIQRMHHGRSVLRHRSRRDFERIEQSMEHMVKEITRTRLH